MVDGVRYSDPFIGKELPCEQKVGIHQQLPLRRPGIAGECKIVDCWLVSYQQTVIIAQGLVDKRPHLYKQEGPAWK